MATPIPTDSPVYPYEELDERLEELIAEDPLTYEPVTYDAETVDESEMARVRGDRRAQKSQRAALAEMLGIAEAGGLTMRDRERIAQHRALETMASRGGEQALGQDLAERGMGGQSSDFLRAQMSQQGLTQANAAHEREIRAMAQQRALDAYARAGEMGTGLRGQSYDEARRRAEAVDALNRGNIEAINQAQRHNVALKNRANLDNAFAPDQLYGMKSTIATGKARGYGQIAEQARQDEQREDESRADVMGVAGGVIGAMTGSPAGVSLGAGAGRAAPGLIDDDEDE